MSDLDWIEISTRFSDARNWWIATCGPAGPHSVPVWGVVIDETLYFYGQPSAVRSKNLVADPRLVAHLESGDSVLILHAEAHLTDLPLDSASVVTSYANKYSHPIDAEYLPGQPGMAGTLLFAMTPSHAISWELASSDEWTNRRWQANKS